MERKTYLGCVRDARQRLSTKPKRGHRAQIAELPELGRREALAHNREVFSVTHVQVHARERRKVSTASNQPQRTTVLPACTR